MPDSDVCCRNPAVPQSACDEIEKQAPAFMPVLFVFRLLCLTNLAEWGMIDLIQYISPERSVRSEGKMYEPKKKQAI